MRGRVIPPGTGERSARGRGAGDVGGLILVALVQQGALELMFGEVAAQSLASLIDSGAERQAIAEGLLDVEGQRRGLSLARALQFPGCENGIRTR